MAGIIGMRGPDIAKRDALRGYKVEFVDADRPIIRPHTGAPILSMGDDDAPRVERHLFGFTKRFSSFNARADRLQQGQMWSRLFGKGHGVAPVSYILEWSDLGDGQGKRPFRIERADGASMAVPCLTGHHWEEKESRAFALVTVPPNRFVGHFHDRVIAQLDDGDIDTWLHPEAHDASALLEVLGPGPDDGLVAYPLRTDVGAARFDDPAMLEAVGPPLSWEDVKDARPAGTRDKRQTTLF